MLNKYLKKFITAIILVFTFLISFAQAKDYDVYSDANITEDQLEREVSRIYETKKNAEVIDGMDYSIKEYDLAGAYYETSMTTYTMIRAHDEGISLEDMAKNGKGRVMVPVVNNSGNEGFIMFECKKGILIYTGMGYSEDTNNTTVLSIASLNRILDENNISAKRINIYKNELYGLNIVLVETNKGRFIITKKISCIDTEIIKDYEIYSEKEFWNLMNQTFDEAAMDPNSDGGIPLRNTSINGSNNNSNSVRGKNSGAYMIILVALDVVLLIGLVTFITKTRKKKSVN